MASGKLVRSIWRPNFLMTLVAVAIIAAAGYVILRSTHAATCTVDAKLVNSCRAWLGARSTQHSRAAGSDLKSQLSYEEGLIGRQADVVHDYATPGTVLSPFDVYAANRAGTYLF